MIALLHSKSVGAPPIGIWWVGITGEIECYYDDPGSIDAARGRLCVEQFKGTNTAQWEEWFETLSSRPPYFVSWDAVSYEGDPRLVLKMYQRGNAAA